MKKEEINFVETRDFVTESYPKEVYSLAVKGLIYIAILGIGGIVVSAILDKSHEGLIAITSASAGGLVAIFARNNSSDK